MQATILQIFEVPGDPYYAPRIVQIIDKFKLYRMDPQWRIQAIIKGAVYLWIAGYAIQQWDNWVPWRQDWFINLFQ